ncbi:MAG: hypothetical protein KDK90_28320 [Leptospiraceae bacterium]|nr:hypothetical protein [Leptospiraceae bacterium]
MKVELLTKELFHSSTLEILNCLPDWCPPTGECQPEFVCAPTKGGCIPHGDCGPDCNPAGKYCPPTGDCFPEHVPPHGCPPDGECQPKW